MTELMNLTAAGSSVTDLQLWWNGQEEDIESTALHCDEEAEIQRLLDAYPTRLHGKRHGGCLRRSLLHPFGRPSLLHEQRALKAVARLGVTVPRVVYCGARKKAGEWQALLVTEALEGFITLDEWYNSGARQRWGEKLHEQMLRQLGATLSRLHRGRWQHGHCHPEHVLVRVQGSGDWAWVEIALLDLEQSRHRWSIAQASRQDLDQLYRHRQNMPEADWNLFRGAYERALANPYGDTREAF